MGSAFQSPLENKLYEAVVTQPFFDLRCDQPSRSLCFILRQSLADERFGLGEVLAAHFEAGPRLVKGYVVRTLDDAIREEPDGGRVTGWMD